MELIKPTQKIAENLGDVVEHLKTGNEKVAEELAKLVPSSKALKSKDKTTVADICNYHVEIDKFWASHCKAMDEMGMKAFHSGTFKAFRTITERIDEARIAVRDAKLSKIQGSFKKPSNSERLREYCRDGGFLPTDEAIQFCINPQCRHKSVDEHKTFRALQGAEGKEIFRVVFRESPSKTTEEYLDIMYDLMLAE